MICVDGSFIFSVLEVCWASWICGFWSFTKTRVFLASISSNIFYQLPSKLFGLKPEIACVFGLLKLSYHTLMLLFIFSQSLFFLCGFISFYSEVSSIHYFFSTAVLNILSISSGILISDTVLFFFESLTWVFVCFFNVFLVCNYHSQSVLYLHNKVEYSYNNLFCFLADKFNHPWDFMVSLDWLIFLIIRGHIFLLPSRKFW